ncbi:hypothetical protein LEN_0642 [Lysobacter enzymogenes]|uniref:Uncharacterized protein n=1 Tax=Lysobacter enzymogenes TaxID=69 RepID=A0AAU9AJ11_LYSEN|nr:hypothetical protein LEN_0642 [Lysobacter enzymogenes]
MKNNGDAVMIEYESLFAEPLRAGADIDLARAESTHTPAESAIMAHRRRRAFCPRSPA